MDGPATTRLTPLGELASEPAHPEQPVPISAARSPKSPKAERHGACDGRFAGAPLPGSPVADPLRASRRSASPV